MSTPAASSELRPPFFDGEYVAEVAAFDVELSFLLLAPLPPARRCSWRFTVGGPRRASGCDSGSWRREFTSSSPGAMGDVWVRISADSTSRDPGSQLPSSGKIAEIPMETLFLHSAVDHNGAAFHRR